MRCPLTRALAAVIAVALLVAACGGSAPTPTSAGDAGAAASVPATARTASHGAISPQGATSLAGLLGVAADAPLAGDDVMAAGSSDLPAGKALRLPVGILETGGEPVRADGGAVALYVASSMSSPLLGPFPGTWQPLRTDETGQAAENAQAIYVVEGVRVPAAGTYDLVAVYEVGGRPRAATMQLTFTDREATPAVGSPAPRSDNRTLADVGGDATRLTTRRPPDTSLLQDSIADLIDAHTPFVVVFASPLFCTSRICGPVVDVALDVQQRMQGTPMRFVHVEVYEGNDPSAGPNAWVREWNLPTEPWIFVVGADGRIRAKFEGAVGVDELERAARAALGPA